MNLIKKLGECNPRWRDEISADPIEAAIELGLIEPEEVDPEMPKELDFRTVSWYGEYDQDE